MSNPMIRLRAAYDAVRLFAVLGLVGAALLVRTSYEGVCLLAQGKR